MKFSRLKFHKFHEICLTFLGLFLKILLKDTVVSNRTGMKIEILQDCSSSK